MGGQTRPCSLYCTGLTVIQVSFTLPPLCPEQKGKLVERQIKASENGVQFGGCVFEVTDLWLNSCSAAVTAGKFSSLSKVQFTQL